MAMLGMHQLTFAVEKEREECQSTKSEEIFGRRSGT